MRIGFNQMPPIPVISEAVLQVLKELFGFYGFRREPTVQLSSSKDVIVKVAKREIPINAPHAKV